MVTRSNALVVAAAVLAIAVPVTAAGLKQVGTIAIPGEPIDQFGVIAIDQATGLGYLADKDNKGVVVFDTNTDKFVSRITGFVGMTKDGNKAGPNGVIVVNNTADLWTNANLWVSDGDSTIKVVDLTAGRITGTIPTGGKSRANAMALDPVNRVVIVANSNDDPPYLSLISAAPDHKILAKIPIADSAEN